MKLTTMVSGMVVTGTIMMFAALNASAFPLKLNSVSGVMNTTAHYGTNIDSTSSKITKVSFNQKTLFLIISNQVALNSTNPVPKVFDLMFDPYTGVTFLTNNLGYYYNLSGIADVNIYEIATSFKGNANNGSENDVIGIELNIRGYGSDGLYYQAEIYGTGKLSANLKSNGTAKMNLSANNGSGYAEYKSSDSGVVSSGKFSFSGTGSASSTVMPYSIWWWND